MDQLNYFAPSYDVFNLDEAEHFVRWAARDIGLGFHPDTRFADYVDLSGSRLFSDDTAKRCDDYMADSFGFGMDPYQVAIDEWERSGLLP